MHLTHVLDAEKRFEEEEAVLVRFIEKKGMHPWKGEFREWRTMMVKLAELLDTRGGVDGNRTTLAVAERIATKVLEVYTNEFRAHMALANVWYRTGRLQEAEQGYRAVLSIVPEHAGALNNLAGILQMDAARVNEALHLYSRALSSPDGRQDPAVLNSYAAVLSKWPGRYAEAHVWFEAALAADPSFDAARKGLVWVKNRMQKQE